MKSILTQILSEIKSDDNIEKIRRLCDKIQEEEKVNNISHPDKIPIGPNVLLSLEVPGRYKNEIAYLTLERESSDVFILVLFTISLIKYSKDDESPKRQKTWVITDHRPEKILTEYAMKYKYLRGE